MGIFEDDDVDPFDVDEDEGEVGICDECGETAPLNEDGVCEDCEDEAESESEEDDDGLDDP